MGITREEHLKWCKERALAYVEAGEFENAFASMVSDLNKHPETANHSGAEIGLMLMMGGHLASAQKMREFINGFH